MFYLTAETVAYEIRVTEVWLCKQINDFPLLVCKMSTNLNNIRNMLWNPVPAWVPSESVFLYFGGWPTDIHRNADFENNILSSKDTEDILNLPKQKSEKWFFGLYILTFGVLRSASTKNDDKRFTSTMKLPGIEKMR